MNPLSAANDVQEFLEEFPVAIRRRGEDYYRNGAVLSLACMDPGLRYVAQVRGGQEYQVTIEYDPEDHFWDTECTCPVIYNCKHAYAAMLALRDNAAKLLVMPPSSGPAWARPKHLAVTLPPRQPVSSSLLDALLPALKRRLKPTEAAYVQMIQYGYREACNGQGMTLGSLRSFSPELKDRGWENLDLWPKPPKNDLQFWLYCAWELRRRGLSIPEFLQPITDLESLAPAMREWERQKSIANWRVNLEQQHIVQVSTAEPIDFRLLVLSNELRLQWKTASEPGFKDLKQTHLRRLMEAEQAGSLALVPEGAAVWLSIRNPYDFYSAFRFSFSEPAAARMLSRLLRLPGLAERILTANEQPLARPAEPLRYHLAAAAGQDEDYELGLLQADGSPAPPVLLVLPGDPTLYLTASAVYQGPPPHRFGRDHLLKIPAPALESVPGVQFLQELGVDLPPRIAQRVRRVKTTVKIVAALKPTFPGSHSEAAFLKVSAQAEGREPEVCGSSGWYPESRTLMNARPAPQRRAADDGLIPVVDNSAQRLFPARLEALNGKWDGYAGSWRVTVSKKFPQLFVSWLASLPPEVEVELDGELASLREAPLSGSVELDLEEAGVDWFDLRVALKVSDTTLTPAELKLLLNARGGYVRLGEKGWRRLQYNISEEDDERLARLGLNSRDFTAEPQRLHALQLADESARKFLPDDQVEKVQRRAAELKARVAPPVPAAISAQLRPYQVEGFHFLAYLTANRFGGVLADDMGLGKTLQALTWLSWLRGQPAASSPPAANAAHPSPPLVLMPSLVVCPKSVMDNWQAEARRFCAGLRVHVWRGEDAAALEAVRADTDLIVLNYAQLRSLSPEIARHPWQAVILDEAQYIKNPDSQTAQAARALRAESRLALTGTPIENRLLDLWSILAFAMPGVLGNRAHFARSYDRSEDPFARRRLSARVRPFLLRRLKSQVASDLPDRVEEDIICEMEGAQKTLYRAELKRAQQMLLRVTTQKELNEQRFNFLTSLLRLRQICCHPALLGPELRKTDSAKVHALHDLIEPLLDEGHKVLVFSQFLGLLDILRDMAKEHDWPHFYLAGETEDRGALVEKFQKTEGAAIFLISLKAGGFGLNLTAASYVVLFDPWWNPAVEAQAIDRTHRIGQTSKVIAYRLLLKDSIEQKIRQLQQTKAALAEDVLGEEKFSQSLSLDDLRFLFADEA